MYISGDHHFWPKIPAGDWQNCGGGGRKILDIPFHIYNMLHLLGTLLLHNCIPCLWILSDSYTTSNSLKHHHMFLYFSFSVTNCTFSWFFKFFFPACFDTIYIVFGGINYTMRAFELAGSRLYTVTFPYVIYPFTNIGNKASCTFTSCSLYPYMIVPSQHT